MSHFSTAFDQTLKHHRIKAVALSRKIGISNGLISDFRHGRKATTTETLERMLAAMEELAPGSRGYFYRQLAGSCPPEIFARTASDEQLARVVDIVAQRLRSESHLKQPPETCMNP